MASSSRSASASTSTADGCKYDVFLNHRGPDVKNTFVSHLYNRLTDHRLRVFLDREEIRKGEKITDEIDGAIRAASINLAIFSPKYCQSPWCLNELLLMLEMKLNKGSTILPIFFHVKPSELRWTEGEKGVYAEALSSLQRKRTSDSQPRYDSNIIAKWKEALYDVAEISGFELDEAPYNGDEGKLLTDVVEEVLKVVPKIPLHVAKYPTGLVDKVEDFEKKVLLQKHEGAEARVVGIVGLGGVGKTTLAKQFFNSERTKYPRSSFLSDVREKYNGRYLKSLQRQLIKDLSQEDVNIDNTDEGISLVKRHLSASNALIVVDDVDHIDQLEALISPAKDVLSCSSLILVTSRNMDILTSWGIGDLFIYKLEGLNPKHSTELFCSYAFRQPHSVAAFEQVVNEFLDACNGLPLSLKVIGALLYGKNIEYWKGQLRKISKILPEEIQKTLKISYDSLDEEEKQIFRDIACFFIGEKKDRAIRIWDGSGWEGSLGLQNLQNKCLVEVKVEEVRVGIELGETEFIRMHDHLRDLGRSLADKEHFRRFWSVTGNRSDTSPVKGIKNSAERDGLVSELQRPNRKGSYLESVFNVDLPPQLIMLRLHNYPYSASKFSTENLRILHIEEHHSEILWEHESEAPLELRELHVISSRLSKIPESIGQLKHLETIVLRGSHFRTELSLETLPDEFCQLLSLKHLELSYCQHLRSLPDSFGKLTSLQHFKSYWCKRMEMLPNSFGNLTNLQHLDLCGCSSWQKLPDSFGNLTKLQHIELKFFQKLEMLPTSFGNLTKLQHIRLIECRKLQMLPNSFGNLTNLQHLDLCGCKSLQKLPDSFGNLTKLQHIDLTYCRKLQMLPNSFRNLVELKFLCLIDCERLTISSETLGKISTFENFSLSGCMNEVPPQLTDQRFLQNMYLGFDFKELPSDIGNLCNLKILKLESSCLEMLPPSFGHLRSLEELKFISCPLKCFPDSIRLLTQLKKLRIRGVKNLERLEFKECSSREVTFQKGAGADEVETATDSTGRQVLSKVDASEASYFINAVFPYLQHLEIQYWDRLVEVGALPTTLQTLNIEHCNSLVEVGALPTTLQTLHIEHCNSLVEVGALPTTLQHLQIAYCDRLVEIGALPTTLQTLLIFLCERLEELPSMQALVLLEKLETPRCGKLKRIDGLAQLTKLRYLSVSDCSELEELPGIEQSRSLKVVAASGCPKLRRREYERLPTTCTYIREN